MRSMVKLAVAGLGGNSRTIVGHLSTSYCVGTKNHS
jgi:hypothetical protein